MSPLSKGLKKVLYIAAMVLAVVTLVVSLAGIIGAWVMRSELHQTIDVVTRLGLTGVQRSRDLVARIDPPLARAQAAVQNAQTRIQESGQQVQDTNLIIAGAERLLNEDLSPQVNALTTTLAAASDTLQATEDTLDALARLPFVDGTTGPLGDARQLINDLQEIEQSARDARQALQTRKDQAVQTVVETLVAPLDRLNTRLAAVSGRSQSIQAGLSNAEARLPVIASQAKTTISVVVVVTTLALVWTLISQIIVFAFARERLRRLKAPAGV